MKVICTKTFTYENATFIKNLNYYLVKYNDQNIFYVGVIPDNIGTETPMPVAAYPLSLKYKQYFKTLTELRKEKIININERK